LHDVDDRKYFPNNINYENGRKILSEIDLSKDDVEEIIHMIDVVSTSKYGDKIYDDDPIWYYVPRYCDRLEGTGLINVYRTLLYS